MKAYGLPRELNREFPDISDIKHYAMQTGVGQIYGSNHAQHSYVRKSSARRAMRRWWKRRYRMKLKLELTKMLGE